MSISVVIFSLAVGIYMAYNVVFNLRKKKKVSWLKIILLFILFTVLTFGLFGMLNINISSWMQFQTASDIVQSSPEAQEKFIKELNGNVNYPIAYNFTLGYLIFTITTIVMTTLFPIPALQSLVQELTRITSSKPGETEETKEIRYGKFEELLKKFKKII